MLGCCRAVAAASSWRGSRQGLPLAGLSTTGACRALGGCAGATRPPALPLSHRYLAVGGGDKAVHVFDARSGAHLKSYPGHKDIVAGLAFREGAPPAGCQLPTANCQLPTANC
jgi:hypothetical protein